MSTKPAHYFWIILLALLTACGQVAPLATEASTVAPFAWTAVALTQTAMPTTTLPPSTFTPTMLPTSTPPATPTPAQPTIPILTPDAIQVERWQEYQIALAKSLLHKDSPEYVLCEWVILGQSGQEVYVAAVCLGSGRATAPAVIYLGTDNSIQNVEAVEYGSTRTFNIQRLFPSNVQEILYSESMHVIYERFVEHLDWRFSHREELPLVVLSAMPTSTPPATPTPAPPTIPVLTPDAIQVERWREYQTELAKLVLSDSGVANPIYADALCEWDILGRSEQEVYVWAVCDNFNSGGKGPAVIYLETDGSIQKVIAAGFKGLFYNLDLFPVDVQAKINLYSSRGGRADEMGTHLGYRLTHPEEPPLVVLSVMPTATPKP
jgi:hypothetical protein